MPVLSDCEKVLLRSQSGPFSGVALSATPSSFPTRISPHLFRVLLLRRLCHPLPLTVRTCRCGRQRSFGHHRAACAQSALLARRGFAVENAVARVCREAGARVSTNVMVRDPDLLARQALDGRRLEVVAEGLPLFGCIQLAIDAILVSPLHCDGTARPGAAHTDGVALQVARRRKERTYPELVGPRTRSRLVVMASEVGGRWSGETCTFVRLLAESKARFEPSILRTRVELAWKLRWAALLACAAGRAFANSLCGLRGCGGVDGDIPQSHDVEREWRHVS